MTQTALITGASSGIGRELALQFAAHGYDLVLVARTVTALEDVARAAAALRASGSASQHSEPGAAGPRERRRQGTAGLPGGRDQDLTGVRIVSADLSRPGSASTLVELLRRDDIRVDVLVNNAGFGLQGEVADLPLDRQIEMIQLNVVALTELTRLLLPEMLARHSGGVLNVASTAAFQPGPLMSVYYATKAYVLSFTEGLAEEVADKGVKVTCLCPGPTGTEFAKRANMTGTNLFKAGTMTADQVAREGFEAWATGKVVFIPGASNRRGALVVRVTPRRVVRRIVKRLNSVAGT
jgi:short-subunit dehydrogenase